MDLRALPKDASLVKTVYTFAIAVRHAPMLNAQAVGVL